MFLLVLVFWQSVHNQFLPALKGSFFNTREVYVILAGKVEVIKRKKYLLLLAPLGIKNRPKLATINGC